MDIVVPSARAADARLRRSGTPEAGRSHGIAPSLTGRRTTCCVVRGCWWPTTSMLKAREVRTIRVIVTAHAPHLATDGKHVTALGGRVRIGCKSEVARPVRYPEQNNDEPARTTRGL
jgi:hypothetical protein